MNKQIARVNWSRGKYSDAARSTIVDPSPLKQGQRVRVIWGKGKKEYGATVTCYPLIDEIEPPVDEPQLRQAKAKRKLVSTFSHFIISSCLFYHRTVNSLRFILDRRYRRTANDDDDDYE